MGRKTIASLEEKIKVLEADLKDHIEELWHNRLYIDSLKEKIKSYEDVNNVVSKKDYEALLRKNDILEGDVGHLKMFIESKRRSGEYYQSPPPAPLKENSPSSNVVKRNERNAGRKSLLTPELQRTIINLRADGRTYAEIRAELNVSNGLIQKAIGTGK